MKLMFNCSFSPSVNEDILKQIKKDSGINLLEYDLEGMTLQGSKPQLLKALTLLSTQDLVIIDFSHCVSDSLNVKTVRSVVRKAKRDRLSSLLVQGDLPSCLGFMTWRFTTPRTTLEQDEGTVSSMSTCISCNFSDICFQFSILQKVEELKWHKNDP